MTVVAVSIQNSAISASSGNSAAADSSAIVLRAVSDFANFEVEGFVPAYKDAAHGALAINAVKYKDKFAAAETTFTGQAGTYNLILSTMTEMDGESSYKVAIDGKIIGEFTNPVAEKDYVVVQFPMKNITVNKDSKIRVEFNAVSNKKVKEGAGTAYSRGRWTSLAFLKDGQSLATDKAVLAKPAAAVAAIPPAKNAKLVPGKDTIKGVNTVFEEVGGMVAVEAEHFAEQTKSEVRCWYIHTDKQTPDVKPDLDENHAEGASGKAYIEVLGETRVTANDKLIEGENFTGNAGTIAVLSYRVYFNTPGRYYVWVRACSTGAEDNSVHLGIDGTWPETGRRMQWCEGKKTWRWESKQRTESQHCGEPYKIYLDVKEAGLHTVQFSMREDGFEMDKFLLTQNREFVRPEDAGPAEKVKK